MNAAERLRVEEEARTRAEQQRKAEAKANADAAHRRAAPTLTFKTIDDARISPKPVVVSPKVAPNETEIWWQWTAKHVAHTRAEIKREHACEFRALRDAVGEVIGIKARDLRAHATREIAALRSEVEKQVELDALTTQLRRQAAEVAQKQRDAEVDLLKREVAVLREQIGLQKELEELRKQVVVAKSEIPSVPAIEARVDAKQRQIAAEQEHLKEELVKQKDRIGRLRVDHSLTDYRLSTFMEEQETGKADIQFEVNTSRFTLRDIHPEAAQALKDFAKQVVGYQDYASVRFIGPARLGQH